MDLSKKRQEVRDKETLEQRQNDAREEIAKLEKQSKVRFTRACLSASELTQSTACRSSTRG